MINALSGFYQTLAAPAVGLDFQTFQVKHAIRTLLVKNKVFSPLP